MKKLHPATILLALCLLASGASGLMAQYIITGISGQLMGNVLKQVAVVVGLMMFGFGVSAMIQVKLKKNIIAFFIGIECLLAILCGTAPLIMQWAYGNMFEHFVLVQYLMAFCIGVLIGTEIPLVMRINEKYVKKLDENLATTFSWDYIGAGVGSVMFIWLLSRTGLQQIALVGAGINLVIALLTFGFFAKFDNFSGRNIFRGAFVLCSTAVLLIIVLINHEEWREKNLAKLYSDTVIYSKETPYQKLVITQNPKIDDWRLFINGNLQFSSHDEHIYHENLVHPVMQFQEAIGDYPNTILILGGGDGIAAREVWKYEYVEDVTMVDLDPYMTKIARTNPVLSKINGNSLDKTEVVNADAYNYINELDYVGQWDTVIIDFPDPNHIDLNKLYTYEFYKSLYQKTRQDVFIVVQSTSPAHATESFLCINRTLQSAGWNTLPYHDNVPTFGDWGWIIAWKDRNIIREDIIQNVAKKLDYSVNTIYSHPRQFLASTVFSKEITTDKQTINTNNNPYLVNYYIRESEVWD